VKAPTLNTWVEPAPEVKQPVECLTGFEKLTKVARKKRNRALVEKRVNELVLTLSQIRQRNQDEVEWQSSWLAHFGPFLEGIKAETSGIWLYYLIFLGRRLALVGAVFFLNSFPLFQITLFTTLSFWSIMFLVSVKPYRNEADMRQAVFNEVCIYVCSLHCVLLLMTNFGPETINSIGISLCVCLVFKLVVNVLLIMKQVVSDAKRKCQTKKVKTNDKPTKVSS